MPKSSFWHMDVSELLSFGVRKKFPLRDLAVLCRKAAFLLGAGLPLKEAVPVLAGQAGVLGVAVSGVHSKVMQGVSFSRALEENGFPVFMCGYIAIGERMANLPEVCERLAVYYEARAQADKELAAAMIYPVSVSLVMLAVIVMAVTLVLPGYSRIFEASGVALPPLTVGLLSFSNFLAENSFIFFGSVLAVFFLVIGFFRTKAGKLAFSRLKLKIPVVRLNVNSVITQALSLLLASGESLAEAVPMCANITDNLVVKNDLDTIASQVNSGMAFSAALEKIPYIDSLLAELARVGEDTGRLPQTLEKCSAYFEDSYRHAIRRINKLAEPVITLVLGGILAMIMLAIILPTFELATAI